MSIPWKGDLLALQASIRKARKSRKITQTEAGAIIGVTERTYRDWENGAADIPASSLFLLAASLGIRVFDPMAQNRKNSSGFASPSKGRGSGAESVLRNTKRALPPQAAGGR